tara:strand:- start:830 stop:1129 length:300 start_codon:yes stop_codon:yes gene_type:complete
MASKDRKEERSNREEILNLQYYFGEDADEWIDKKQIKIDKVVDTWRNKSSSEYPPYFCNKCNKYWAYELNNRRKKITGYLKKSLYGGLPCKRKVCNTCL